MSNLAKNIGPKISELRERRGLTQEDLEEKSGVPRRTIQNIEHGQTKDPGIGTISKILKALRYSWADIEADDRRPTFNQAAAFLAKYAALEPELQEIVWAIVFEDETLYGALPTDLKRALK